MSTGSLAGELEGAITSRFYGGGALQARLRAQQFGFQSPLWLWTHRDTEGNGEVDFNKTVNLMEWLRRNNVPMSSVAVMVPMTWKSKLKDQLLSSAKKQNQHVDGVPTPHIFAHHELTAINKRDGKEYRYEIVLYVLGASPKKESIQSVMSQEAFLREALHASTSVFILSAEAGWRAPSILAKWTEWKLFVSKMVNMEPPISAAGEGKPEGCFPRMIGPLLPLCCALHPLQRQLEKGIRPILPVCERLCMKPFECKEPHHVCGDRCHPSKQHIACDFHCAKALKCGHPCLNLCTERCNCYEAVEQPLRCSHEEVLGLDRETAMPIYATVHHSFRGVCEDVHLPCHVEYESECALCLGPLRVKCFEAVENLHTPSNRTLVCLSCKRAEREMRANLLGDVLITTEKKKETLRKDLQKSIHHQQKAAAHGLYTPGARVEITDPTRCVAPLFDDDFPGIQFVDLDDPAVLLRLEGAHGSVIGSHVDVMNRSELRNLIRLPDGLHVLVTDGGLRLLRALTSNVIQRNTLAIEDRSGATTVLNETEFNEVRSMIGKLYYLSHPVACDALESGSLTDKIVKVTAIDPTSPKQALVSCCLQYVHRGGPESEEGEPTLKKIKMEEGPLAVPGGQTTMVVEVAVPLEFLEPLGSVEVGKSVFVTSAKRQINNLHDMELMQRAVQSSPDTALHSLVVTASPLYENVSYSLAGLLNAPLNTEDVDIGPCALLRQAKVTQPFRTSHQRYSERFSAPPPPDKSTLTNTVSVIPLAFVTPDELSAAQSKLDSAALEEYEKKFVTEFKRRCEEVALKNEEAAFRVLEKRPTVSKEALRTERVAYSIPVALPSEAQIAKVKSRKMTAVEPSQRARKTALKASVVEQKEKLNASKWLSQVGLSLEQENKEENEYIDTIQKQLIYSGVK